VKIVLYRVLQEALANGYRHAGVDTQEVYLSSQDGWVILEVCDDGGTVGTLGRARREAWRGPRPGAA
jgi:signal transduction histidine kinase